MRIIKIYIFLTFLYIFSLATPAYSAVKPYWVFFKDRGSINVEQEIAAKRASFSEPKSLSRRARVLGAERIFSEADLPVEPEYIAAVEEISIRLRTVTRFLNGVSVELDEKNLEKVLNMPFVREIRPVTVFKKGMEPEPPEMIAPEKKAAIKGYSYGGSYDQLSMINVIPLHEAGYMGSGLIIAVLDSGFDNLQHTAFDSLQIAGKWDFVDNDDDPVGHGHGTRVLSVMAALDNGSMIGTAPYASYLLARTEIIVDDQGKEVELRIEEDNWVAGIEWADSLGADIVNSSLGYVEFDDGSGYTYNQLNGDYAVTTIAADIAAAQGIIVVTSAGNKEDWDYISTPADGDSVFAIGSVNRDGDISSFSAHGPTYDGRIKPDLAALGENVLMVNPEIGQNGYLRSQGTSFSSPAVAGAVALILEANPLWGYGDLREALISTAIDKGIAGADTLYGYGIVNAMKASGVPPYIPVVSDFKVYDPYPQPIVFNDINNRIYFPVDVPEDGKKLTIKIFTFTGEIVQTLEEQITESGTFRSRSAAPNWTGTNFTGEDVAPGIYYYTIRLFGYETYTGKLMVLR